jgi:hypothetical protein
MAPGTLILEPTHSTEEIRKGLEPSVKEKRIHGQSPAIPDSTRRPLHQTLEQAEGIASEIRPDKQLKQLRNRRTSILPASGVTTDFDELRFEAAAGRQLEVLLPESKTLFSHDVEKEPQLLISSPYNHPNHLLDLQTLDSQNRLLALALTAMKPITPDYATGNYLESFNWPHVLTTLRKLTEAEGHEWTEQKFYTVIFQSKVNESIDRDRLGDLDQHSHREATESGGLLKYWFGAASEQRENLATCKHVFLVSISFYLCDLIL